MGDNVWRPAHLTLGQMEQRRLAAATLLRQGRLSQAEIARHLGVSPASVSRWAGTLAQQGRRGLEAQPITGRPPRLDETAWARLSRLLDRQCNACVKRTMENALPGSVADLHRLVRREFSRLQRRPEMIVSFFRHAGLSVAGLL